VLNLLMASSLLILGGYSLWFFFKAKTFQSLTLDDLALTWKMHKQKTECKAANIHTLLLRNNEVVGFKCECGNEFLQKRLITQKAHTYIKTNTPLLTSPKITNLLETKTALKNLGLHYSHIKEV